MQRRREHTIEYYLSKGYLYEYAVYYSGERRKIVSVKPIRSLKLLLNFDNGETRILDLESLGLVTGILKVLKDEEVFNRVSLDENRAVCWDIDPNVDSNVVWNNRIDLDPDVCYVESKPI